MQIQKNQNLYLTSMIVMLAEDRLISMVLELVGRVTPGITQEFFHVTETPTTTTNRFKIYLSGGGTIYYDGYIHYGFKRT